MRGIWAEKWAQNWKQLKTMSAKKKAKHFPIGLDWNTAEMLPCLGTTKYSKPDPHCHLKRKTIDAMQHVVKKQISNSNKLIVFKEENAHFWVCRRSSIWGASLQTFILGSWMQVSSCFSAVSVN